MPRTLSTLSLCGGLIAATAFFANPASAMEADARSALAGQPLRGQALLRIWGFEVYDATLYAPADFDASRFEQQAFGLELHYRRRFEGKDIAQRSIDEMQAISPLTSEQARRWQQAMVERFPDVRPGDRILGVHRPGQGARFFFNGKPLGDIADATFSARFFGIWLSPATSQPGLREALLASPPPAPARP